MSGLQRLLVAGTSALLLAVWSGVADDKDPHAPRLVKLAELIKEIQSHKGKVVVMDAWTDGWLECKKEFPHLVKMHEKYAKEGLVAVSLNLDDPEDKPSIKNAREFLKEQKVTFPSFILDETQETWQKKLNIGGPPVVFVFGRDGKVARKFDEGVDYKVVEKAALEELKKKP